MRSDMHFQELAHHRAVLLPHYDGLHLLLSLIAKTDRDDVS